MATEIIRVANAEEREILQVHIDRYLAAKRTLQAAADLFEGGADVDFDMNRLVWHRTVPDKEESSDGK